MARRCDSLEEVDVMKWKFMFCGHDVCCKTEKIAAIDPRM